MRVIVLAAVVAGCYNPSPPSGAPCGEGDVCPRGQTCVAGICGSSSTVDAAESPDAPVDVPAACASWNARHFDACTLPASMGDLNLTEALGNYELDTTMATLRGRQNTVIPVTTMVLSQTDGPEILLLSVDNFTLERTVNLDVDGPRALLIAVNGTATIEGSIAMGASLGSAGPGGASAPTSWCAGLIGEDGATQTPSTGGGGAAYQGGGGRGGNAGGLGGTATGAPTNIRGGCPGGLGGSGGGLLGNRGAGGGAIVIGARTAIFISNAGSIRASGGGGGLGTAAYGAGGGGGAGGLIGLDSPMIAVNGFLGANGAGGGGGASDIANGSSGSNGAFASTGGSGGAGAAVSNVGACAAGGTGGGSANLNGQTADTSSCGGGGGGGGAGYILTWQSAITGGGTISPPAITGP